jgi:hypothetical protein
MIASTVTLAAAATISSVPLDGASTGQVGRDTAGEDGAFAVLMQAHEGIDRTSHGTPSMGRPVASVPTPSVPLGQAGAGFALITEPSGQNASTAAENIADSNHTLMGTSTSTGGSNALEPNAVVPLAAAEMAGSAPRAEVAAHTENAAAPSGLSLTLVTLDAPNETGPALLTASAPAGIATPTSDTDAPFHDIAAPSVSAITSSQDRVQVSTCFDGSFECERYE